MQHDRDGIPCAAVNYLTHVQQAPSCTPYCMSDGACRCRSSMLWWSGRGRPLAPRFTLPLRPRPTLTPPAAASWACRALDSFLQAW